MRKKPIILTSLLGIFVFFLNLTCCKDCPDCPTCPERAKPGSYYVYIADWNQDEPGYIWVVDSETDSLIDSIPTPVAHITVMDVSSDGQFLAAFGGSLGRVLIYDTDLKDTVASVSPSDFPYFTLNNEYLLIQDIIERRIYKYAVSTWSLVASDTMLFDKAVMFNTPTQLLGITSGGKEYVIYDYETMSATKIDSITRADGSTPQALATTMSSDDRHFYFLARPDKVFKFEIESSSIVDSILIIYGTYNGSLKWTPNGTYLLVTESSEWPDPPLSNLLMIDQDSFSVVRRIPTYGLNSNFPGPNSQVSLEKMAITRDGSKVFTTNSTFGVEPPLSFNLLEATAANIKGLRLDCGPADIVAGKEITK
jgi:hypothetical protein